MFQRNERVRGRLCVGDGIGSAIPKSFDKTSFEDWSGRAFVNATEFCPTTPQQKQKQNINSVYRSISLTEASDCILNTYSILNEIKKHKTWQKQAKFFFDILPMEHYHFDIFVRVILR